MNWKKWAAALLLLPALLVCAHAQERGSIQVVLDAADGGGSLELYRVADENLALTEDFYSSWVILDDPHSPQAARLLADWAALTGLPGERRTVEADGSAVFDGLDRGLYLIIQKKTAPGRQSIRPFLVSIPEGEEFCVTARPKTAEEEPQPSAPVEPNLPQTGQTVWPVFVLLGSGLTLLMAGVLVIPPRTASRSKWPGKGWRRGR